MAKVLVKRYGCGHWTERVVEEEDVRTRKNWGGVPDEVLGTDATEEFEKVAKEVEVEVSE